MGSFSWAWASVTCGNAQLSPAVTWACLQGRWDVPRELFPLLSLL